MKYRIGIWASAGFLVAAWWGFYFTNANKENPISPIVFALTRLTQPLVAVTNSYFDFPRGLTWVEVENAVTYALVGLIVETIRRRYRHATLRHSPFTFAR